MKPPANPELEQLIQRYFDDQLDAHEIQTLETHLNTDPAAVALYHRLAREHSLLSNWGKQSHPGNQPTAADRLLFPAQHTSVSTRKNNAPLWLGLAAAACLLLSIFLARSFFLPASPSAIAHLDYSHESTFGPGSKPTTSGELRPGSYELLTGIIRFKTAADARVTLSAPARFELVSSDFIRLEYGKVTAWMLNDAARLTIRSGEYGITDLGTSFGLNVQPGHPALVSVFDGAVTVDKLNSPGASLKLAEGESALRSADTAAWQQTTFKGSPFADLWPLTLGINEASDLVRFLEPGPLLRPLRDYADDTHLFLIPEAQHINLPQRLRVNLQGPSQRWPEDSINRGAIEQGCRASSYLLLYNPEQTLPPGQVSRISGSITFSKPILGVICGDHLLAESDLIVGLDNALYGEPHVRGQNPKNIQFRRLEAKDQRYDDGTFLPHDQLRLSADEHTLHFDIHVSQGWEQFRILVAAPDHPPAP